MELRLATHKDLMKVINALRYKHLTYLTPAQVDLDYRQRRLYVVADNEKVLATVSLVPELQYNYTAIKRLCICNKKNQGKGIARYAIQEITKIVQGNIGATPWDDNAGMRHLLESEGFELKYTFDIKWCFYCKTV